MLALFFIGVKFSDRPREREAAMETRPGSVSSMPALVAAALVCIGIVAAVAAMANSTATRVSATASALLPAPASGWTDVEQLELGYAPKFTGYDESLAAGFIRGDKLIELHEFVYREVTQDSELVNQQNRLFDPELWRLSVRSHEEVVLRDGRELDIESATLYRPGQRLRIYNYYIVGGRSTASRLRAKLIEIYDMALGRSAPSAFVAVATPLQLGQETTADEILRRFVVDHHDRLLHCLSAVESTQSDCLLPSTDQQTR
jgi:EpsI family protein